MSTQPRERRNWTAEEDRILEAAVAHARAKFRSLPWQTVALNLPGRTNKDCRKRWHYILDANVNKGSWTIEEDEKLRNAVAQHGTRWAQVAAVVDTRNGDQCAKRWQNTLDPSIDRTPWTLQDNCLLLESVRRHGHKWTAIVEENFPGRTALSAKNQYSLIRRNPSHASYDSETTSSSNSLDSSTVATPYSTTPSSPYEPAESVAGMILEDQKFSLEKLDFDWEGIYKPESLWGPNPALDSLASDWQNGTNSTDLHLYGYNLNQGAATQGLPHDRVGTDTYSDMRFPYQDFSESFNANSMAKTDVSAVNVLEAESSRASSTSSSSSRIQNNDVPPDSKHSIVSQLAAPLTKPNSTDLSTSMKQLTVTMNCTSVELQQLMRMTIETLSSLNLSIDSQRPLPTATKWSGSDKRQVSITASCSAQELGKFMSLVTDSMSEVSFAIVSLGA